MAKEAEEAPREEDVEQVKPVAEKPTDDDVESMFEDEESEEQVTDDQTELDDSEEEVDEDKQNLTKKLEQVNYELQNLKKQVASETRHATSPEEAAGHKKEEDTLEALLQNSEFEDPSLKTLVKELKAERDARRQLQEEFQESLKQRDQQLNDVVADRERRMFIEEHPDLEDQYDDLVEKAKGDIRKAYEAGEIQTAGEANLYARFRWKEIVSEAASSESKSVSKKAAKTTPDKPTKGAKLVAGRNAGAKYKSSNQREFNDPPNEEDVMNMFLEE